MERSLFRPSGYACATCRRISSQKRWQDAYYRPRVPQPPYASTRTFATRNAPPATFPALNHRRTLHQTAPRSNSENLVAATVGTASLGNAQKKVQTILNHPSIPSEEETLEVLKYIEAAAEQLVQDNKLHRPVAKVEATNPTSALLNSLSTKHASARQTSVPSRESEPVKKMIDALSKLAFQVVDHELVFLTAAILKKYVELQTLLLRPQTFPDVFDMYANKPAPQPIKSAGSTIEYRDANPKAIAVAIDPQVADMALEGALQIRNLTLALDIIETTYQAPAFQRAKIFRKAVPPLTGAALMPLAAWTLASQMASHQTGVTEEAFTQIAFAGIFTYTACVGTIGYVALTTANDQMQRVTWVEGMPLRERWLREEERAALDKVALAWGLRQQTKWGEEEGAEWEELREYIGLRGMVLDKVALMDGMQ